MAKNCKFYFVRLWPREVMYQKKDNKLLAKQVTLLQSPGIYILYRGDEPYYVGKADCLFERLHTHSNKITDKHYGLWDHFSCFAFLEKSTATKNQVKKQIKLFEGILIAAMPKTMNSATPRFPKFKIPQALRSGIRTMAAGAGATG